MASIRKRGKRWQVQVRRKGQPALSRSFALKRDADAWALETERMLERGSTAQALIEIRQVSFGQLLKRYQEEVTPHKGGAEVERYRLQQLQRHRIAKLSLSALQPRDVARYRDERLSSVQPGTVLRELSLAQRVLEVAMRDWGYLLPVNPVKVISKPAAPAARQRRLYPAEEQLLLKAAQRSGNRALYPAIVLALETALRRGELLSLCWRDLDLQAQLATIRKTKTGQIRTIPLSPRATATLDGQKGADPNRVLPTSTNALRLAWQRVIKRTAIEGLTFHDLRHEAVSRLFEKGLSMPEVALISGHQDPRMLFRYTHLDARALAKKL